MTEIRRLSAVEPRIETGPAQFGDDWPCFILRGDNAFAIRIAIATILVNPNDVMARMQLHGLMEDLDECNLNRKLVDKMQTKGEG